MKESSDTSNQDLHLAMDLYGMAIVDYLNGEREVAVLMHRDDGFTVRGSIG